MKLPVLKRFAAISTLLLVGCSNSAPPPAITGSTPADGPKSSPKERGVIGISVLTMTNPFFREITDSLTEAAKKAGYKVEAVSGEFDVAKQQNQVKDFIVKRVSAIVLCPVDSKAIGPAIKEANQAGIPVFTADIACLALDAKVVAHIATDNYAGGKEAGKAMLELVGAQGGEIAILDFPVVESCILRVKGFRDVIDEHNKTNSAKIKIVATLDGGGLKDKGYKVAEDLIQAHPNIKAIFAINDPSALGARAALEKAGKADQVKLIAFDGQPEGKQAIKDGKIYADPIQFPGKIGAQTVDAIVKHLNGEKVPAQVLIPTALYRQADGQKDTSLK